MGIQLQGGKAFDEEFIKQLPTLEKQMTAQRMDPEDFTFDKAVAKANPLPMLIDVYSYDYTVTANEDSFTVTLSNDMVFLDYFSKLCASSDAEGTKENKESWFAKAIKWFEQDPLKEDESNPKPPWME